MEFGKGLFGRVGLFAGGLWSLAGDLWSFASALCSFVMIYGRLLLLPVLVTTIEISIILSDGKKNMLCLADVK